MNFKVIRFDDIDFDFLKKGALKNDMIIFSHLRWDFVYQRPQHIISRLSKSYKILVIEEPLTPILEDSFELGILSDNLSILRPRVDSIKKISDILTKLQIDSIPIAWFYSASFIDLLENLKVGTLIYDCMDELSQFKGASFHIKNQEKQLLERADIVFTGGKSLYEEKSKHASNVFCFPSSVDVVHFGKKQIGDQMPEDIAYIPKPIVGYIGVIDERIDLDLLRQTAIESPNISFVMIGPLAKIDDRELPREGNIHYLGMKNYKDLPGYLNCFDIAMMPFAINEATQFISPTKTLEYMAAGKPIISTSIKDVVRDYLHTVNIVHNSHEFCNAIKNILYGTDKMCSQEYKKILDQTSWDNTVYKMNKLISQKV